MYTIQQIRNTLEILAEFEDNARAKEILPHLSCDNDKAGNDFLVIDIAPGFYSDVIANVKLVTKVFRDTPQGIRRVKGLTVSQIGDIMDGLDEPWPNDVIATAIQYIILAKHNKLLSAEQIMSMKFNDLDMNESR